MTGGRGADCEAQSEAMYGQGKQAWVTLEGKGVPHPWALIHTYLEMSRGRLVEAGEDNRWVEVM
jgi:hypothetical protein